MLLTTTLTFALLFAGGQAAEPAGDELTTAYNNLKDAEQKKDSEQIKKWAVETSKQASLIIKASASAEAGAADKHRIDLAKELGTYADYALFSIALRAPDAARRIELFETLQQLSPDSEYVPQLYGLYAGALTQTKQTAKLMQFAEKGIAKDPSNEDLLIILADAAMARKQWDRAATLGTRLASVMSSHARPNGLPVGDWESRRGVLMGRGYWIAGLSYANSNRYPQADKNLRAALPYVKGDDQMTAGALFFLGVSNYNLARATHDKVLMKEAVEFSQQAASIRSPYQQQASQNVYAMKAELGRMR